jgi:hypothetical protein
MTPSVSYQSGVERADPSAANPLSFTRSQLLTGDQSVSRWLSCFLGLRSRKIGLSRGFREAKEGLQTFMDSRLLVGL